MPDDGRQNWIHWNVTLVFAFITGIATFLVLIYILLPSLSPIAIFLGLIFLLYPFRQNPLIKRLLWLSFLLFCVWIFDQLIGVLMPFVISFLFAYVLNPIVNKFERRNIPRWFSALIIITISTGLILWFFLLVMPVVIRQFQGVLLEISSFASSSIDSLKDGSFYKLLNEWGIPVDTISETLEKQVPAGIESILSSLLGGASNLLSSISAIIVQIINIILIPFVTFYILKDFPIVEKTVLSFAPELHRPSIRKYLRKTDEVLGQYFRGAMIVALIQGVISTLVLSLLGVRYAIVLGVMTALLDFIPYVGLIISLVVSTIVASFSGDPVMVKVLGVIIMYLVQKVIENSILAPKIIGKKVGLHPVLLMMSLFVFGYFFGFVGLLIAVPLTAVLIALIGLWREKTDDSGTSTAVIT
jgi:predicted PurR-regulated permease PerM